MVTSGDMVWCVICIGGESEPTHIFSSVEHRDAFLAADSGRSHVCYDYMIDNPDRMEKPLQ